MTSIVALGTMFAVGLDTSWPLAVLFICVVSSGLSFSVARTWIDPELAPNA